jgi:hypothetical protein
VARRRVKDGPALPGPRGLVYLTRRQFEVLGLAARGLGNREIAAYLGISSRCVEDRFDEMRERTEIPTKPALLAHAGKAGLVLRGTDDEKLASARNQPTSSILADGELKQTGNSPGMLVPGVASQACRTVSSGPCPWHSGEITTFSTDAHAAPGHMLAFESATRTGALIGYVRIDSVGELLDFQQRALTTVGCIRVFADKRSGRACGRPEFSACLSYLRPGDTLVVASLGRLSLSLTDLVQVVGVLRNRGIGLRSLREDLDTTAPCGQRIFHFFAALTEFSPEPVVESSREGRVH